MNFPTTRLRRLRQNSILRTMVQETRLTFDDFVLPLFIRPDLENRVISSMPGHLQIALHNLPKEIDYLKKLGINKIILFGIPEKKDATGDLACETNSIIQQAIKVIKNTWPECFVISDICFCEYTSHGHCGILTPQEPYDVDNDATLLKLADQALSHAQAGADMLAPSGMMDGAVGAIRHILNNNNFTHLPILSYAVKYASAFYGPFREAAEGTPQFGDRKTYQMNPANAQEALREAQLDLQEGADILMIKPAGPYLDVLHLLAQNFAGVPLAAYQVSGEYSMIQAAAAHGWVDEKQVALESLLAIKRAGANFIITYFAKKLCEWL